MKSKPSRLMMVLALAGLAPGCFVGDAPLSPATTARADAALLGTWRCVSGGSDDNTARIRVVRAGASGYDVEFSEAGKAKPDRYRGHGSTIGGRTLLNLQEVRDGKPTEGWVFVRYDLPRADLLDVRVVSDRNFKDTKATAKATAALEKSIDDPTLYEDFCACVRLKDK